MAKKIKDFDDFDDDFDDLGLDDESFDNLFGDSDGDDYDSKSDRSPASKSKSLFRKGTVGLRTIGSGAASAVKSAISGQFPTATGVLSGVKDVPSTFRMELDELNKNVGPSINELKQFKNRLTPRIKAALGITSKEMPDDDYDEDKKQDSSAEKEALLSGHIKSELDSIFKAERKRGKREARQKDINDTIESVVASKRHLGQLTVLQDIKSMSTLQHGFNKTILTPFLKKNLELKYRHLYVAQETLALQRSMASTVEAKLEEIRHNTALPNEAKVHMTEVLTDTLKRRMSSKLGNTFSEIIGGIASHNIKENIAPMTEMLGMLTMPLEMWLEGMEMEEEMAEMTGVAPKSLAQSTSESLLTMLFSHFGKKKFGSKIKDFTGETLSRFTGGRVKAEDTFGAIESTARLGPGEFKLLLENLQQGRPVDSKLLNKLPESIRDNIEEYAGIFLPDMKTKSLKFTDSDLTAKTAFDVNTKRSIVETIPGYLAKILSQVTQFNTKRPTEELVYDFQKRAFVSSSIIGDDVIQSTYGTLDSRKQLLDDTRKVLAHKADEKDVVKLDALADDFAEFTKRSIQSRWSPLIRHEDIREAFLEQNVNYNEYIQDVLTGVKKENKLLILEHLNDFLFYPDGKVNYTNLNDLKASLMMGSDYLEGVRDVLIETIQSSPHASQILPKIVDVEKWMTSGEMVIDRDKVSEIMDEGWVFGDASADLEYEDLVRRVGETEAKKILFKRRWEKKRTGSGTAGGKRAMEFPTAHEVLGVDTYSKDGVAAAMDYMLSYIDPNSTVGQTLAKANLLYKKGKDQVGTTATTLYREAASSTIAKDTKKQMKELRASSLLKILSTDKITRREGIAELKATIINAEGKTRAQLAADVRRIAADLGLENDSAINAITEFLDSDRAKSEFDDASILSGPTLDRLEADPSKMEKAKDGALGLFVKGVSGAASLFKKEQSEMNNADLPPLHIDSAILAGPSWDAPAVKKAVEQAISKDRETTGIATSTAFSNTRDQMEAMMRGEVAKPTRATISELQEQMKAGIVDSDGPTVREDIVPHTPTSWWQRGKDTLSEWGDRIKDKVTEDMPATTASPSLLRRTVDQVSDKIPRQVKKIPGGFLGVINNIVAQGDPQSVERKQRILDRTKEEYRRVRGDGIKATASRVKDYASEKWDTGINYAGQKAEALRLARARDFDDIGTFSQHMWGMEPTEDLNKLQKLLSRMQERIPKSAGGFFDSGTFDTEISPDSVYGKQVEILELIADHTGRTVEELSALKEGMALVAHASADEKQRGILSKIFGGTEMAAGGLFRLGLGATRLASKGLLGTAKYGAQWLGFGMSLPFRGAAAFLKGMFGSRDKTMTDVYTVGADKKLELLVDKNTLQTHGVFEDGKKVTSVFDITEPVFHGQTKDVLIGKHHIEAGLYDKDGKELADGKTKDGIFKKLLKGVGTLAKIPFKLTGLYFSGVAGLAKLAFTGASYLFRKRNPYIDVYLKGNNAPGSQLIYGEGIKRGEYVRLDGSVLKSAYQIDSPIYAKDGRNIGNCVITEEQIKAGLVDVHGKKLEAKRGKSIIGRAVGVVGKAAGMAIKGTYTAGKFVLENMFKLLGLPFKGIGALGKKLFGKKDDDLSVAATGEHLKTYVGDKLDVLIDLVRRGFKLDVEDDITGDGLRDGSYKARMAEKEREAQARRDAKGAKTEKDTSDKGWLASLFPSMFGGDDEKGSGGGDGWLKGVVGTYLGGKFFSNTKLGRRIAGSKLGRKFGGKAAEQAAKVAAAGVKPGLVSRAGGFIGKHGRSALKFLPPKARTALLVGGSMFGASKLLGRDAEASTVAGMPTDPSMTTDEAMLVTDPSSRDATDYDNKFLEARTVGYGFAEDYRKISEIIFGIEEHAYLTYTNGTPISNEILLAIAENYVSIDESNQQEVLEYFREWWEGRVLPVFYTFVNTLEAFGIDPSRRNFFGAETDDKTRELVYKTYINNYNSMRKGTSLTRLIPSDRGFQNWRISSKHAPNENLAQSAEDVKHRQVDKAKESMSLWGKTKATGIGILGAGLGYKLLPSGGKEALRTGVKSIPGGARNILKGVKMPGAGMLIDSAFIGADMYDAYKEDDTDSMIQRAVRGIGSVAGGAIGGLLAGGTTLGVGSVAGYIGGSYVGEKMADVVAAKISALFSSDSGPGIFGKPANEWNMFKIRADLYGIDDPIKYEKVMEYIERLSVESVSKGRVSKLNDKDAYRCIDKFGYEPKVNTVDKVKHFKLWYVQRFYPIFFAFYHLLDSQELRYEDLPSITKKQVHTITQRLVDTAERTIKTFDKLKPNKESYEAWYLAREKGIDDLTEPLDNRDLDHMRAVQEDTHTRTSSHTDADIKDREAALAINQLDDSQPTAKQQARMAKADAIRARVAAKHQSIPQAEIVAAVGVAADDHISTTPVKYAPVEFKPGTFGWVAGKFESESSGGSLAIGYDRNGGTSYGKYQFASAVGGFADFIRWLPNNGGQAFYDRIVAAVGSKPPSGAASKHWGNTYGRTGKTVDAWIAGVQAGELGDLEDRYFQNKVKILANRFETGYKSAKANPELANLIRVNPAYQEMALSSIVQHGDWGGMKILSENYHSDPALFIDAVYKARGGRFGSSTGAVQASARNRMEQEHAIIRQFYDAYAKQGEDYFDQVATGDTPLSDTDSTSVAGAKADMTVGIAAQAHTTTSRPPTTSGGGASSVEVRGTEASPNRGAAGDVGTTQVTTKVAGGSKYDGQLKDLKLADSGVDIQNLHPRLKKALAGLNAEFMEMFGHPIQINSGFRSLAKQQALFDKYGPSRAARPSKTAPHMWHHPETDTPAAIAVDAQSEHLNKADKAGLLAKYGVNRPLWPHGKGRVKPESWHLQLESTIPYTVLDDMLEPSEDDEQEIEVTMASTTQEAAKNYAESISDDTTEQTQVAEAMEAQAEEDTGDTPVVTSQPDAIDQAVTNVPGLSPTTTSTMSTTTTPTLVAEAGPTQESSMENIAMMQLEQLRLVVQSLTSIDGNTKNLSELDMASLEAPIQSLADRISGALASIGDTGNHENVQTTDSSVPFAGRRPVSSNRINMDPPPVSVSSKRLST